MPLRNAVDLRQFNTLRLVSQARYFATLHNDEALDSLLAQAHRAELPVLPIGEGSNLVLLDELQAVVLHMATRGIQQIDATSDCVSLRVAAGENWHELVSQTVAQGYYGLENLALIPGLAGAAPVQNIGAYGVELSSVLQAVHCTRTDTGEQLTLSADACELAYRDSIFKHGLRDAVIITAIDIRLSLKPQVHIQYPALREQLKLSGIDTPSPIDVFQAVVAIRKSRLPDPHTTPNAGSFFKNPVIASVEADNLLRMHPSMPVYRDKDGRSKLSAAWMIDRCGWKGGSFEGFAVHEDHALVLVNESAQSGAVLLELASQIKKDVMAKFGVALEIEPRIYGAAL